LVRVHREVVREDVNGEKAGEEDSEESDQGIGWCGEGRSDVHEEDHRDLSRVGPSPRRRPLMAGKSKKAPPKKVAKTAAGKVKGGSLNFTRAQKF
jgi:hypothetical protein